MSNIQAKDLIQAKALGCLDTDDDSMMIKLMEEDAEFPWQELGQYQNLVAFLPTLLDIETPEQSVKDNIAQKLSELELARKAAEMPEPEPEPDPVPEIPEPEIEDLPEIGNLPEIDELPEIEDTILENPVEDKLPDEFVNSDPDIKIDEEIPEEILLKKKGISFKDYGMPQIPSEEEEEPKEKIIPEKKPADLKPDRINRGPSPRLPRKDLENKNVKSYVSKSPVSVPALEREKERIVQVKSSKAGVVTAIVLFIITLLILAFMYFKFSGDIQKNKDDIEGIKKMFSLEENYQQIMHHPDFS